MNDDAIKKAMAGSSVSAMQLMTPVVGNTNHGRELSREV